MSSKQFRHKALFGALLTTAVCSLSFTTKADARWIKATLTGMVNNGYGDFACGGTGGPYPVDLGTDATCTGATFHWTFGIQDYTQTGANSTATWFQSGAPASPMYGSQTFSPQTSSLNEGLSGTYAATSLIGPESDEFAINKSDGSSLFMRTNRNTASGVNLKVDTGSGPTDTPILFINLSGSLSGFSSTSTSDNVRAFLEAALTNNLYECSGGGCGGTGTFGANEGTWDFTWSAMKLEAVPAPLPIVGASIGFGWSRRLRQRLKKRS